jgi:hypothetical protein
MTVPLNPRGVRISSFACPTRQATMLGRSLYSKQISFPPILVWFTEGYIFSSDMAMFSRSIHQCKLLKQDCAFLMTGRTFRFGNRRPATSITFVINCTIMHHLESKGRSALRACQELLRGLLRFACPFRHILNELPLESVSS